MSITFWNPDAPTIEHAPQDDGQGGTYVMTESADGEVNVSGSTAQRLLEELGYVPDDCGTIPLDELDTLHQRCALLQMTTESAFTADLAARLQSIAVKAKQRGHGVSWG